MKIITLRQPWATAIALGRKRFETRSWSTHYRGLLAIHAAKHPIGEAGAALLPDLLLSADDLPYGAIVAIVDLKRCLYMVKQPGDSPPLPNQSTIVVSAISETERRWGDWRPGRFAWSLWDAMQITPIPCQGVQGLRDIPLEAIIQPLKEYRRRFKRSGACPCVGGGS